MGARLRDVFVFARTEGDGAFNTLRISSMSSRRIGGLEALRLDVLESLFEDFPVRNAGIFLYSEWRKRIASIA